MTVDYSGKKSLKAFFRDGVVVLAKEKPDGYFEKTLRKAFELANQYKARNKGVLEQFAKLGFTAPGK